MTMTDFVNPYPSMSSTIAEVCVGIVKAVPLHYKNPAQHFSDLVMLSQTASLHPIFLQKSSSAPKQVDCIRVDGATDEGPCHETIQYWWTVWHITQSKAATLVITRSSGSSHLNHVKLQNGCQSLGHANTFIPSTPGGSCLNPDTGCINQRKIWILL